MISLEMPMCQNANHNTTAVSTECRHKFGIYTDQEGSYTYLQQSDGFRPDVKIRILQKGQIMVYTHFHVLHLHWHKLWCSLCGLKVWNKHLHHTMYVCTMFGILDEVQYILWKRKNECVTDKLWIGCHGRKLTNTGVY